MEKGTNWLASSGEISSTKRSMSWRAIADTSPHHIKMRVTEIRSAHPSDASRMKTVNEIDADFVM